MRYKFPRIPHIHLSPGFTNDDIIGNSDSLSGNEIIITEKMDGENTSIYWDGYIHARSIDSNNHSSRNWIKNYAQSYYFIFPKGWRVVGENLYAKHSLLYEELESYFYAFAIFDENNVCLDWETTVKWFNKFHFIYPKVLYAGKYEEKIIKKIIEELDEERCEGFVIRNRDKIKYNDFSTNVFKYVRENHVNTDEHWTKSKLEKKS